MRILVVILLSLAVDLTAVSQSSSSSYEDSNISHILNRMQSASRSARKAAFNEMVNLASAGRASEGNGGLVTVNKLLERNPRQADAVRVGLIHLLEAENMRIRALHAKSQQPSHQVTTDNGSSSELHLDKEVAGEDEYYPTLLGVVTALQDDRAIPALLGAATSGGMATRAVAKFGDRALEPTLSLLKDPDSMVRSAALFTIRNMLKMGTLSELSSLVRVNIALRESLRDPDFIVRNSAISAIEYVKNREEFIPALTELAEHDQQTLPVDSGRDLVYPVRLKAKRLLQKIANHDSSSVDSARLP